MLQNQFQNEIQDQDNVCARNQLLEYKLQMFEFYFRVVIIHLSSFERVEIKIFISLICVSFNCQTMGLEDETFNFYTLVTLKIEIYYLKWSQFSWSAIWPPAICPPTLAPQHLALNIVKSRFYCLIITY